jgi:predicted nuclease of predicted toxin-antitoxin system
VRLLADENVHGKVVSHLRSRGYTLDWVKEIARSAEDAILLVAEEMRDTVFITNDGDFTDLIFKQGLPPPLALLYTRTEHRDWELTASLLVAELERGVTTGQIATLTKNGVRRRAFPLGATNA